MATSGGIQQGSSVAGSLIITPNQDQASSDSPTVISCDGSEHDVLCVTVSPPEWMDDAGNIIEAGQYQLVARFSAGDAPTVPGAYMNAGFNLAKVAIPIDALPVADQGAVSETINLGSGDVPFDTTVHVNTSTDVTATASVDVVVSRLATIST